MDCMMGGVYRHPCNASTGNGTPSSRNQGPSWAILDDDGAGVGLGDGREGISFRWGQSERRETPREIEHTAKNGPETQGDEMIDQKTNDDLRARITALEDALENVIQAGEDMRRARPNAIPQWLRAINEAIRVAGGTVSLGARDES